MASGDARLRLEPAEEGRTRARAVGDWTFEGLQRHGAEIRARLAEAGRLGPERVLWDLTGIGALDDTGAVWLARALSGAHGVEILPQHGERLRQLSEGLLVPKPAGGGGDALAPLVAVGRGVLGALPQLRDVVALLGALVLETGTLVRRPREWPLREWSAGVYRAGVTALPVTMLVGFLVGVVLTYLAALQLQKFGAELLVVNIVGVGVLRELGPMLASIIAAGRSGSAMTAQLGAMRVTEEIEALAVMGVSVTARLVLPKVAALAVALPLVAFATDLAALAGAIVIAHATLGIPPAAFLEALPRAVEVVNFWIGIGKSAVFGFAIALVACHYGLRIRPNTDSLSVGVTRSVVAAITIVILLDAVFAVLLRDVG